jgi:hypothetical protein
MGIIYLLQLREFVKSGENIYKIGRSSRDGLERIKEYPKQSKLLFLSTVGDNTEYIESLIIKNFKEKFVQRTDIGTEYFEGDYIKMIDYLHEIFIKDKISYTNLLFCVLFISGYNKKLMQRPENKTVIIENINSKTGKINITGTFEEMKIDDLLEFSIKGRAKQVLESFPDLFDDEFSCMEKIKEFGFKYFTDTREVKEIFKKSFL